MMEEEREAGSVPMTQQGGTKATQAYRDNFLALLRQWREQGDEQEQRDTFEMLRKALPHKFPSEQDTKIN